MGTLYLPKCMISSQSLGRPKLLTPVFVASAHAIPSLKSRLRYRFGFPLAAWGISLLLLVPSKAFALEPGKLLSQYGHTAWRMQDAVLPGPPRDITQTADGYLWIATRSGLVRYDGAKFVPFTVSGGEALRNPVIYSMRADRNGSLWLGTGFDLEHWENGRLTHFPEAPGAFFGHILHLADSRRFDMDRQRIVRRYCGGPDLFVERKIPRVL